MNHQLGTMLLYKIAHLSPWPLSGNTIGQSCQLCAALSVSFETHACIGKSNRPFTEIPAGRLVPSQIPCAYRQEWRTGALGLHT